MVSHRPNTRGSRSRSAPLISYSSRRRRRSRSVAVRPAGPRRARPGTGRTERSNCRQARPILWRAMISRPPNKSRPPVIHTSASFSKKAVSIVPTFGARTATMVGTLARNGPMLWLANSQHRNAIIWRPLGGKAAVLSDVTAQKEYGVTRDSIARCIQAGKLEYREGAVWGNSYLGVLRSPLELYISGSGWRRTFDQQDDPNRTARYQQGNCSEPEEARRV